MNTEDLRIAIQHKIENFGLSQTKVAELLEINRSSLSRFLSSGTEISGSAVMKLSHWVDQTEAKKNHKKAMNDFSNTLIDLVESLNETEKLAAAGAVLAIAQIRSHKSSQTCELINDLNSMVNKARIQKIRGRN